MKKCHSCKDKLPVTEFYRVKSTQDGLHRNCKQCCKVDRSLEGVRKRDKRSKISVRQVQRCLGIMPREMVDITVKLWKIYKRSRGICGVCGRWVQPRHASPDHIIPVSKGGSHTYKNLQLTHLKCNLQKSNKT